MDLSKLNPFSADFAWGNFKSPQLTGAQKLVALAVAVLCLSTLIFSNRLKPIFSRLVTYFRGTDLPKGASGSKAHDLGQSILRSPPTAQTAAPHSLLSPALEKLGAWILSHTTNHNRATAVKPTYSTIYQHFKSTNNLNAFMGELSAEPSATDGVIDRYKCDGKIDGPTAFFIKEKLAELRREESQAKAGSAASQASSSSQHAAPSAGSSHQPQPRLNYQEVGLHHLVEPMAKMRKLKGGNDKGLAIGEVKAQVVDAGFLLLKQHFRSVPPLKPWFTHDDWHSRFTITKTANETTLPGYFFDRYCPQGGKNTYSEGYYDYNQSPEKIVYVIDFANERLGGGCLGIGFVQEERMFCEFPQMLSLVAAHAHRENGRYECDLWTRLCHSGPDSNVSIVPTPIICNNVQRVQALSAESYGWKGLETCVKDANKQKAMHQALVPPQSVNILAIAAPNLGRNQQAQWSFWNLCDIYNTLHAGFARAVANAEKVLGPNFARSKVAIESGKFGCGSFGQHPKAVYLLHRLAAAQWGIDIKMYDYKEKDVIEYEQAWDAIESAATAKGQLIHQVIAEIQP